MGGRRRYRPMVQLELAPKAPGQLGLFGTVVNVRDADAGWRRDGATYWCERCGAVEHSDTTPAPCACRRFR